MPDLIPFGTQPRFPFTIPLQGVPVNLNLGTDIINADVVLFMMTKSGTPSNRQILVASEITKQTSGAHTVYYWTPANLSDLQKESALLSIINTQDNGLFSPTSIVIYTGGHPTDSFYTG